jgi:tRNA(His) guanylyltransferase
MSWRQVDCHINNLYNTCFWALVQQGHKTETEAKDILSPTNSGDKNNMLFSDYGVNYNDIPAMFRKGSIVLREPTQIMTTKVDSRSGETVSITRIRKRPVVKHVDYIQCAFWEEHQQQLGVCLVMPKVAPLVASKTFATSSKSAPQAREAQVTKSPDGNQES